MTRGTHESLVRLTFYARLVFAQLNEKSAKNFALTSDCNDTFYGKFSFVLFTVSIFLLFHQNMALGLQQVGLSFINISHKPKIREVDYRLQIYDHFVCKIKIGIIAFIVSLGFFFHLRYLITTKQFGLKDDFLEA